MEMVLNDPTQCQPKGEEGFPFDDDRNRANIRTYLDEIAARHPEFADQLKEPPWGENFDNTSFNQKRRGSNSNSGRGEAPNEPTSSQIQTEVKEPKQNLSNYGLRNTVPLGPGTVVEERHQRSMSAPPDNRATEKSKRFVTKCEIPVMNDPRQETSSPKPDLAGAQEQPQQKASNGPNVRVIPIQVEGRDAPLLNTNIDTSSNFGAETFRESPFEGRLPREFGAYQRHSPRFAHKERAPTPPQYQYAPQFQQYAAPPQYFGQPPHQPQFMSQQQFVPPQQTFAQRPSPSPPPQQQQQQQQRQQQQHQYQHPNQHPHPQQPQQTTQPPKNSQISDEVDARAPQPPAPPKPEPIKDPIEKVQAVQKEVEKLMKEVEAFNGTSRTDKTYLMLDELLTRQLLHLDNIDTEGKENVRQARKDAIRSIQKCISILENKVPVNENNESTKERNKLQAQENKTQESEAPLAMEVDKTKENTPVDTKENQKMEVDQNTLKEIEAQPLPEQQLQQQQPPPPPEENKQKV